MQKYFLNSFPELIKPNIQKKDMKGKIKELTGVKEENKEFIRIFDFDKQK